jgi:cell division protein FtsA
MAFETLKQRIFNRKNQDQYIVALDIGTAYVKALVGRVTEDEAAEEPSVEVVGVGRQHQKLSDMHSGAIADIGGVVDNCDTALSAAEEMAEVRVHNAVVGIAGELVKGSSTSINYKRPDSQQAIDSGEMDEIMERVQNRALERARAELSWESGVENIEITMVNAAVVNFSIDGYNVTNPVGFQGKDVKVQMFCAFAPMVHIGALERVARELNLNLLGITAEPFAVAKSVSAEHGETFGAVFIDVGGGTTDIALVNEGGVEGTRMFGIGGRSFTSAVAKNLDISFEEAEKRKCDVTAEAKDEDVRKALVPTVKVWLSGVELALGEFDTVDQLPSKILLCGGGSGLPYIPKVLESSSWRENVPIAERITVNHIRPDQVNRVVDKTGEVTDHSYITPMGLLNVGLDALTMETTGHKVANKINKAMQN